MNRLIYVLLLIAAIVGTCGCQAIAMAKSLVFDVRARNIGTADIKLVDIQFPGFAQSGPILPAAPNGGDVGYSGFRGSWPTTARVKWRFRDERPYMPDHEATVAVPPHPKLERDDYLELWFDLDGKQVTARYKVWVKQPGQGSLDFK